ncbi:hypothetical protein ACFQ2K_54120 [Streptomyces sanglieri]|uniref:Uncharacterized protein n=1 Tax=Streptomyces sanglieri TaxID=193460 RepID=A0ABW2XEA4_9ACTN
MAQLVREDVPLVVDGRALLVEEEIGVRGLDSHSARRFDRAERAQRLQDDGLPAKLGYGLAQLAGGESVRQT